MPDAKRIPLLEHSLNEAPAFTASALVDDVRKRRGIQPSDRIPEICILEFDGDLTDWLIDQDLAKPVPAWACFHTLMYAVELEGKVCGIIPRTIGGPFTVLIAEQLRASGAKLTIGLTSAGRVAQSLPLPSLVLATTAIRDEGTSFHYLAPGERVECPISVTDFETELKLAGFPVFSGTVWTTDAPYRESSEQIAKWSERGVLAVEMQAASLYAFGESTKAAVVLVARLSNAIDFDGSQFDTGTHEQGLDLLKALSRAAQRWSAR